MGAVGSKKPKNSTNPVTPNLEKLVVAEITRTPDFDLIQEKAPIEILRKNLRVLYIHGGGAKQGQNLTDRPVPNYLRNRFVHFYAEHVTDTSDFALCVRTQAKAIRKFSPDIVITKSQGGPIIKQIIDQGYWHGPTLLLVPAFVPAIDNVKFSGKFPVVFVFGEMDDQVRISTRDYVNEAIQGADEESQMRLFTFKDGHAMLTILEENANPSLEDLIVQLWAMKARNKNYDHNSRLPYASEDKLNQIGLTTRE